MYRGNNESSLGLTTKTPPFKVAGIGKLFTCATFPNVPSFVIKTSPSFICILGSCTYLSLLTYTQLL